MKILILNGSPKRKKSDTLHITHAFLAGMNEVCSNETQTITSLTGILNTVPVVFLA